MTETEAHVAAFGWDQPVRVFALVRTNEALAADPDIAELLDAATVEESRTDPELLMVVEQEGLPAAADLEHLLAQLAWPESVHGAAISVERLVLPPAAQEEAEAITDASPSSRPAPTARTSAWWWGSCAAGSPGARCAPVPTTTMPRSTRASSWFPG